MFSLLSLNSCNFGSVYGLKEININDSQRLFIKRVSRGFSYEAIVVSTNDNYCAEPNKETEYVFNENVTKRYFWDGNVLYLLIDLSNERLEEKISEQKDFPLTIKLIDIQSDEAQKIVNQNRENIEDLTIPNDKSLRCLF